MKRIDFSGVSTALVTPFLNGKLDLDSLQKLVEEQIAAGVQGLVPVGTTGESPTLSAEEHLEVIRKTVEFANGRALVIAGTGSNSTEEAVRYTREADQAGADAMLQVAPYYNKPSQQGLYLHFSKVAEATEKPIMLYSIPGRCIVEIALETCQRLYEDHPHICAVKEAGGDCDKVAALKRELGEDYKVLSGDDNMTLPFMACGGDGVVSVASNLLPRDLVEMVKAAGAGDFRKALAIHQRLALFFRDIFIEPNPVPIKFLMKETGWLQSEEVRLPLAPLEASNQAKIRDSFQLIQENRPS